MTETVDPLENDRRRLRMRSMRRGIKEMDLILATFADERLKDMDAEQLAQYESMLNENDQRLYRWVSGQEAPDSAFTDLVADISEVTRNRSIRLRSGRI